MLVDLLIVTAAAVIVFLLVEGGKASSAAPGSAPASEPPSPTDGGASSIDTSYLDQVFGAGPVSWATPPTDLGNGYLESGGFVYPNPRAGS